MAAPPIAGGRVAVEDGRVRWVGGAGEAGQPEGTVVDLGQGVLMPGLVNAHCHLELSHLAGEVPTDGGFVSWVEQVVQKRLGTDEKDVRAGARRGISQLESTGTVAVGDVSNTLKHLDLLEKSTLQAVVFHELLSWDPNKSMVLLAAADQVEKLSNRQPLKLDVRIAAHAPHSVSPRLMSGIVKRGGPFAIHLAESPQESDFLMNGDGEWGAFLARRGAGKVAFKAPGLSPVKYLDSIGALRKGLVAAHCVHCDEADRALLAERGAHAVICPRSNAALQVGRADVPALLEAGVKLALGTDSLACVDTLDLMAEAATLQRSFPGLDPAVIVRMATLGGAEALGLKDHGSIASGKRGALAFAPGPSDLRDPLAFLTSGEAQARPAIPPA
ncbi:MAG TPA: amidohydrolase family protein [Vicinamibacteria bacterium]|nr:amidohydrolase family protein [Vicinamibacteria bacterium]